MKTVGAYQAKTHLPELLDEVAKGARVMITKRGVPVAMLAPVPVSKGRNLAEIAEGFRRIREGMPKVGMSIKDMIAEGRRF
ncbi:MAG: type II toxin-antitoxin system Phd/YefM family antitoxin [Pseudomonadota bacterium]